MSEVVKVERRDAVAIVTVNSPPVNALSAAVRSLLMVGLSCSMKDQAASDLCAAQTTASVVMPNSRKSVS